MPYDLKVDPRARIAYLHGRGDSNAQEGQAILVELAVHPEFEPGFGLLCDLREMTYQPTADELIASVEVMVAFKSLIQSRVAFVASPSLELPLEISAALYGAQGFDAQNFSDFDEAVKWIKDSQAADSAA